MENEHKKINLLLLVKHCSAIGTVRKSAQPQINASIMEEMIASRFNHSLGGFSTLKFFKAYGTCSVDWTMLQLQVTNLAKPIAHVASKLKPSYL